MFDTLEGILLDIRLFLSNLAVNIFTFRDSLLSGGR